VQILTAEPEPPSRFRPEVDAAIDAICLKAMAKDYRARFASMSDFGKALRSYLQGPPSAAAPRKSVPAPRTLLPGKSGVLVVAAPPPPQITIGADKIEFACPRCQLPVRTPLATAGKKGMCPNCGVVVQIPAVPQTPNSAVNRTTNAPAQSRKPGAAAPVKRIEFLCSHCGKTVATPASGAGKRGKCPSCGAVIDIPAAGRH
jgi:Zn finger protein HypA/HybF involved in hydrogenase expression